MPFFLRLFSYISLSFSLHLMEKKKSTAIDLTSTLKNLQINPTPKIPASSSQPFDFPLRRKKPRRLVSLCLGVLGQHLEDLVEDLADITAEFPSNAKLAMAAIARRRQLLNDNILLALAEGSWDLLDLAGSDVSDFGLTKVVEMCPNLRAVDISRCDKITVDGVSALVRNCRSLEILRCGGSPRSDFTARSSLNILKPELNDVEEDSWEELDSMDIVGKGAPSLRWLVWPKIDDNSKSILATECPRIILNPKESPIGFRGIQVPKQALASIALDCPIVEDIDPNTWAVSVGCARKAPIPIPSPDNGSEIPMAERFRLAFLERDARLAPKRAKNARQNRRRAEREWLMSSSDAKAMVLASQASKFLRNK